ncbi:hypothetical protein BGZ65_007549, partial [Modicella reniformis]
MENPVNGDKYVRTLSHYLRHNKKRLIPTVDLDPNGNLIGCTNSNSSGSSTPERSKVSSPVTSSVRSLISPADPMASVYSGMVNSIWSVGNAVVNTVIPHSGERPKTLAEGRDSYDGAWDGTGTISTDSNPRERQLYLQAHLKAPIFPLDLYYLLYLLDRFELEGITIDGWDGSVPRAVGDSNPRVLNAASASGNGLPNNNNNNNNTTTYSSFPPLNASARPQSIHSFSSTALSTLTLITGWKQWSDAASSSSNSISNTEDVHFIRKFLQHIQGLRLVAQIMPGVPMVDPTTSSSSSSSSSSAAGKGKIEGYEGEGVLNVLNARQQPSFQQGGSFLMPSERPLLLPIATIFTSLTHLELHKIPPRSVDGWEVLMPRLKSLVVTQALSMEDLHDVIVTAVVESEKRRRRRILREMNRVVWIKQEQREALKDASAITSAAQDRRIGADGTSEDDEAILKSLVMWPVLRHLSVSDNGLPGMKQDDTFTYSHSIVILDLSHNLMVSPPPGLIHLHNLHNLNLSFNMISNVQAIYQVLGNVTVLDLRGNRLDSLCGLERLWSLEKVDVRENLLDEAAEVGRLAALPGIREIWSDKNPFCISQ